nr:hypothetical protein JVH1_9344 [Rhodococcus sp. JVH1]
MCTVDDTCIDNDDDRNRRRTRRRRRSPSGHRTVCCTGSTGSGGDRRSAVVDGIRVDKRRSDLTPAWDTPHPGCPWTLGVMSGGLRPQPAWEARCLVLLPLRRDDPDRLHRRRRVDRPPRRPILRAPGDLPGLPALRTGTADPVLGCGGPGRRPRPVSRIRIFEPSDPVHRLPVATSVRWEIRPDRL